MITVEQTINRFVRDKGGSGTLLLRPATLREVDQMHETGIPTTQLRGKATRYTSKTLADGLNARTEPMHTHKVVVLIPEHASTQSIFARSRVPPEWVVGAFVIQGGRFVPNHRFDPQHQE